MARTATKIARNVLLAALLVQFPTAGHAQGGPFEGLSGSWRGSGAVTLKNGTQERLSCRATYDVENAGNTVRMNLRCASESYKFDLKSSVVSQRGAIGGTWSEDTYRVSGSVSGTASPDSVQARISGPTFAAGMTIRTSGRKTQSVTITTDGQALTRIALTMSRAGA
jgi:hypothetical protein